MAEKHPDRTNVDGVAEATFHVSEKNEETYLQIDTYGSQDQQIVAKVSQSLQFGPEGLAQLRQLLAQVK